MTTACCLSFAAERQNAILPLELLLHGDLNVFSAGPSKRAEMAYRHIRDMRRASVTRDSQIAPPNRLN